MIIIDKGDPAFEVWLALLELSPDLPGQWTLVGAQMVALHGLEHRRAPPRASSDADLVVNARLVGVQISDFVQVLQDRGYVMEDPNPEGIGHRFTSDLVSFDVLGPDGLGDAKQLTTVAPARTIQVPGGTQALHRSKNIDVSAGKLKGALPRPNLLGAILIKARAVEVDDVPAAQLEDLAFLLSLVADPESMRHELMGNEQSWLRRRTELATLETRAWRQLSSEEAENGHLTLRLLTDL